MTSAFHGIVADLGNILPAIAFGIGLTFGFVFDTAGPRPAVVPVEEETRISRDADEPLTAERQPYAEREDEPTVVTTRGSRDDV